jgi:hypothetical protein
MCLAKEIIQRFELPADRNFAAVTIDSEKANGVMA